MGLQTEMQGQMCFARWDGHESGDQESGQGIPASEAIHSPGPLPQRLKGEACRLGICGTLLTESALSS
jgi:hypothetical protein